MRGTPNGAFEVYVADSIVRAVGTAFAVHFEDIRVSVTVTRSVVEVADVDSGTLDRRQAAGLKYCRVSQSPQVEGRTNHHFWQRGRVDRCAATPRARAETPDGLARRLSGFLRRAAKSGRRAVEWLLP